MTEEKDKQEEAPKEETAAVEKPEAPKEEPKKEETPVEAPKEEPKKEEPVAEAPKEEKKDAPIEAVAPAAAPTAEGEKKKKKINRLNLKELDKKIAEVKEKMGNTNSRYALQLFKQKAELVASDSAAEVKEESND